MFCFTDGIVLDINVTLDGESDLDEMETEKTTPPPPISKPSHKIQLPSPDERYICLIPCLHRSNIIWMAIWVQYNKVHHIVVCCSVIVSSQFS